VEKGDFDRGAGGIVQSTYPSHPIPTFLHPI
jgi:hypothetical protein